MCQQGDNPGNHARPSLALEASLSADVAEILAATSQGVPLCSQPCSLSMAACWPAVNTSRSRPSVPWAWAWARRWPGTLWQRALAASFAGQARPDRRRSV